MWDTNRISHLTYNTFKDFGHHQRIKLNPTVIEPGLIIIVIWLICTDVNSCEYIVQYWVIQSLCVAIIVEYSVCTAEIESKKGIINVPVWMLFSNST